ncbi:MAG TPA: hypothetical protein VMY37_04465 [Thermoguttaceae bacterium]|nr:hypothetical protein [Thermoguttaceae bacterium]
MPGYYYLHVNGDMIYKPHGDPADFAESDFVRCWWPVDKTDRGAGWKVVLEGFALGGNEQRLVELANKFGLTYEDSIQMLGRVHPTARMRTGMPKWIRLVLGMEPDVYWEKIRNLPATVGCVSDGQ